MSERVTVPGETTSQEEDLMNHSTKKVKPNGDEVLLDVETEENGRSGDIDLQPMNGSPSFESSQEKEQKVPSGFEKGVTSSKLKSNGGSRVCEVSYKDRLLMGGAGTSLSLEEIVQMVAEDYMLEEVSKDGVGRAAPFNPKPEVEVSLAEYDEWCRPWKLSLIVKVLGKNIGFRSMDSWVHRFWSKNGNVKVIDLTGEFFLVHFDNEGDYKHALFEGPWQVAGHYLLVQRWRPLFQPSEDGMQKLAVWVRIPELPVELYTYHFLWRAGEKIGTMLKIDQTTSIHSRRKFARLCVEVDLRNQLVPAIKVLGKEFKVEYEGLHLICFGCGKYGHIIDGCSESRRPEKESREATMEGSKVLGDPRDATMAIIADKSNLTIPYPSQPSPNVLEQNPVAQGILNLMARADSSGVFGPWMLAKKPQRRFNQSNGNVGTSIQTGNPIGSGSRFQSLEYVEQEESNMKAHVHKEGFLSNKHSVQAGKTKKLELPKHTSSSKSRLAGPKGTSKTQEGRSSREKEGGAKSTEESLVKGKEVVEGISKVNLERKNTEY
ncbi:uncharacterized protein LOC107486291 [Arachis duranensis]|uniref:Uncharacterized protein LOC107486291 n=1 Tax=Arachis duranensis TaxID=130453 RepID=A0A6P4D4U5_ARADU|nr:uncharacterized protein LOC107486291 [Arachis duranensis]